MRRTLLCLTLLVGVIFTAGASPATSSAASNCTLNTGNIYWDGMLSYNTTMYNCTDVDLVEFAPGTGSQSVGIVDLTQGGLIHYVAQPPTVSDVLCGRQYTTYTGTCAWSGHVPSYCAGLTHTVYATSRYRIHTKSSQSWGSWHGWGGANEAIWC